MTRQMDEQEIKRRLETSLGLDVEAQIAMRDLQLSRLRADTRQRAERAADRLNSHGLFTQGTSLIRVADIIAAEFDKLSPARETGITT